MNEVNRQINEVLKTTPAPVKREPEKQVHDIPTIQTQEEEGIYSSFGRYEVTELGVFLTKRGKDGTEQSIKVTNQPLAVKAIGRTAANQNYSILLEWTDLDGHPHREIISKADLEGESKDVRRLLADGGMSLRSKCGNTDYLIDYLRSCNPQRRFIIVDRLGWHKNKNGRYFFALADKVIGVSGEEVIFNSPAEKETLPALEVSGTTEEWKDHVSSLCLHTTRGTLAVCLAFAAPLVRLLNKETFGVHLKGKTSRGKSTAACLAASVYGTFSDYKKSWQGTAAGLEGLFYNHNDMLLILDEINNIEPRELSNVVYSMGNEAGKNRGAKNGSNREVKKWKEATLSTGEETVENILKGAGLKSRAGLEVRLPSVNAQATDNEELGVNESFPPCMDAQAYKRLLNENCRKYHGAVFESFISYLTGQDIEFLKDDFANYAESFKRKFNPNTQNKRIVENFALVAYAGELATGAGLTGWTMENENGISWAREAVEKCLLSTLEIIGNGIPIEDKRALEHIENLLTEKRANFLNGSTASSFAPAQFWGYVKIAAFPNVNNVFYIPPTIFAKEFCQTMGEKETAQLLKKYGILETESGRLKKRVHFQNENSSENDRKPYYVIRSFSTSDIVDKELARQAERNGI